MSERDVITQVDALIGRHRSPHAGTTSEDDLPVLTEVVESGAVTSTAQHTGSPDPEQIAAIRLALARELEAWLDEKLPGAVLRVIDGLSDQLITQVAAQARLELLPRLKAALDNEDE